MDKCRVDGCQNGVRVRKDQLCMKHYQRMRRTGTTEARKPPSCRMPGCNQPRHADGCCMTHYQSIRRMKIRHGTWNPHDQEGQ